MSTLPDPQVPDPQSDPDGRPLSDRERGVLDEIAGRENAGDPGFVTRLRVTATADPSDEQRADDGREALARARRRDLAIQGAVLGGLAGLLLPATVVVAAVVTMVLLVVPLVLVARAWREANGARPGRDGPAEGRRERGGPEIGPAA